MRQNIDIRPERGIIRARRHWLYHGLAMHHDNIRSKRSRPICKRSDLSGRDMGQFHTGKNPDSPFILQKRSFSNRIQHKFDIREINVISDRNSRIVVHNSAANEFSRYQYAITQYGMGMQIDHHRYVGCETYKY